MLHLCITAKGESCQRHLVTPNENQTAISMTQATGPSVSPNRIVCNFLFDPTAGNEGSDTHDRSRSSYFFGFLLNEKDSQPRPPAPIYARTHAGRQYIFILRTRSLTQHRWNGHRRWDSDWAPFDNARPRRYHANVLETDFKAWIKSILNLLNCASTHLEAHIEIQKRPSPHSFLAFQMVARVGQ